MRNDDLIYDWLDFTSLQKERKKYVIKENIIPTPNQLIREPRTKQIKGIVIHHTVTNTPRQTLAALAQRASTNYEVDKGGNIYEYIDPDESYAIATGGGANSHTVAIDVTTGNGDWPSVQVDAVRNLVNNLASKYNISLKLAPDGQRANWSQWESTGQNYTLFRHRNFANTACPVDFPMESLVYGTVEPLIKDFESDSIDKEGDREEGDNMTTGTSIMSALQNIRSALNESKENKIFSINDKTKEKIYSKNKKYFNSLLTHLKKELKINKPVKIILEEDEENSKKVLGRTGGYVNHEIKIHIFCTGRHIKDILRSLSHEMVHHHQNLRGEFKNHEPTERGYAQSNKHLRKMEEEAYLKGNILFRDWEDNYKYRNKK